MSRSGYDDCEDNWAMICWRGAVASAIRGKRGQGGVCALGALAQKRGMDVSGLDQEDYYEVAKAFDVNRKLVQEIVYMNDECAPGPEWDYEQQRYKAEDIEQTESRRWQYMRDWVVSQIKEEPCAER